MTATVVFLVLSAALLHATWNLAGRKVRGNLVVFWLGLVIGSLAAVPFAISDILTNGRQYLFEYPGNVCILVTGILHGLYYMALSKAYAHGGISLVYPVARGSGIGLTGILAVLLLHEQINLVGGTGIVAVAVGIMVLGITVPGSGGARRAVGMALLVGAATTAYSLVDKVGVRHVHPVTYMVGMWSIAAIVLIPLIYCKVSMADLRKVVATQKRYVIALGPMCMITYLLILYAFTMGPVSYIAASRECSVVIGCLFGVAFLKERVSRTQVIAITVIVGGMVLIILA